MDIQIQPARTFIQAFEVCMPLDGKLVRHSGNYIEASANKSFGAGERLPGRAWKFARPLAMSRSAALAVKRRKAAPSAGHTSGVALPNFASSRLKAARMILCSKDCQHKPALKVWSEKVSRVTLADGYFSAAKDPETVSRQTGFGHGQGLPVPVPGGRLSVLALLSPAGSPFARLASVWNAKIGTVLAKGLLRIKSNSSGLAAGYIPMLALPIHRGSEPGFVVAWYL
jgi:hypothetical protein